MTLVIAGHDIDTRNPPTGSRGTVVGLFVTADSTITSGVQTLLSGFKKIYTVPVKVYKPSFTGVYFHGYHAIHQETNIFIAFAGATLSAQHVLNAINNHMSNLRIGHISPADRGPGTYTILMNCQENSLLRNPGADEWDEDMFTDEDIKGLLSGDIIANIVLHSIRGALASAQRYKIDEGGWKSLITDYVVGTYCEAENRNRMFTFTTSHIKDEFGVLNGIQVDKTEIEPGELAVLGLKDFSEPAKQAYSAALERGNDVKSAMFDFLNLAIDQVQTQQGHEIDRPSVLHAFARGTLTELKRSTN